MDFEGLSIVVGSRFHGASTPRDDHPLFSFCVQSFVIRLFSKSLDLATRSFRARNGSFTSFCTLYSDCQSLS